MKNLFILSILLGIWGGKCADTTTTVDCEHEPIEKLKGVSFVAPPDSFGLASMETLTTVNANWVTILPYGFTRPGEPIVWYDSDRQWWGERPEGVRHTIKLAREVGLKIMLKPQIYVPGDWTGGLDFPNDKDWSAWEKTYEDFILPFADMAEEYGIELFCIGTEFEISVKKRPEFWHQLIPKIKNRYKGKLTYASNWDGFGNVTFWQDLDYVGIDAYFPLIDDKTPDVDDLVKAWQAPLQKIKKLYCEVERPILFTEYGYMSVNGCAYNTWDLEKNRNILTVNEQAQANAFEGLFATFWKEDWWAGGFLWKWYSQPFRREGYRTKDYTPQGKTAAQCIKKWYGK